MELLPTQDGLLVARALVTFKSGWMQVHVCNISNSPLRVYPYHMLGKLSVLDSCEVFDDGPEFQLVRGDAVKILTQKSVEETGHLKRPTDAKLQPVFDLEGVDLAAEEKSKLVVLLNKHQAVFPSMMRIMAAQILFSIKYLLGMLPPLDRGIVRFPQTCMRKLGLC